MRSRFGLSKTVVLALVVVGVAAGNIFDRSADAAPPNDPSDLVQVGTKSTDSRFTTQVRTTMTQPSAGANYPSGGPYRYYWIATRMSDGTFFQAGYADPDRHSNCSGLRWFVAAFDSSNNMLFNDFGYCGMTGTRTFSLEYIASGSTPSARKWVAKVNGSIIKTFYTQSAGTVSSQTAVVSEVSQLPQYPDFTFSTAPWLPPVKYSPAVQIVANGSWTAQAGGRLFRGYFAPCSIYYVADLGYNAVRPYSGSGGSCSPDGTSLW